MTLQRSCPDPVSGCGRRAAPGDRSSPITPAPWPLPGRPGLLFPQSPLNLGGLLTICGVLLNQPTESMFREHQNNDKPRLIGSLPVMPF